MILNKYTITYELDNSNGKLDTPEIKQMKVKAENFIFD